MLEGVVTAFGTLLVIIVILYLAYICTKYIAKSARFKQFSGGSRFIAVVDQVILGQDSSVVVAKVSGRVFLLGITSNQISLLTELNSEEFPDLPESGLSPGQGVDFKDIIGKIRDRKK